MNFNEFLIEIRKNSIIKLSLLEQDEWEEYFNKYKNEITSIQSSLENNDREIDKMVYAIYGLSTDEIMIIEKELKN